MLFRQRTNFLIRLTLILHSFELWGCTSGTLVFNGSRLIPIEQLCAGVEVTSFTRQWYFVPRALRFCNRAPHHEQLTNLIFQNGESITVARCQKFLLFDTHQWICAHKLVAGSRLVRISNEPCVVQQVIDYAGAGPVWHVDVGCPHTFFISHLCVLTHNTDCTMIMSTALKEGFIASALAGTSCGATITALLASWGAKIGFSGGALTFTAPLSLPLCCAAVGGAALGAAGYYAYKLTKQAVELEFSKSVITSAEHVAGEITNRVQVGHQEILYTTQCVQPVLSFSPVPLLAEKDISLPQVPQVEPNAMPATTVEECSNESALLNTPHDTILLYQQPSSHKSHKHGKKNKSHRRSHDNKPPKDPEGPIGVEDVAKVTTAHRIYEFVKKKWRECKSACHDVYGAQSKTGQQCSDCKGPAFRAHYKENPKHGVVDNGIISRRPTNGEQAMYNSISWDDSVRKRIGTSNGELVALSSSGDNPQNEYHGYVVGWKDIGRKMQKLLVQCGLTDKSGRPF